MADYFYLNKYKLPKVQPPNVNTYIPIYATCERERERDQQEKLW